MCKIKFNFILRFIKYNTGKFMKKLEINKKDLKNNIEIIKQMNQETEKDKKPEIIGVVKANGVGLDLIQYSKFLVDNGINTLAVAVTQEAIKLRKEAKIENDIIMLSPRIIKEEIKLQEEIK